MRLPKSHDLVELATFVELQLDSIDIELLSELYPYYVISRYRNASLRRPWKGISQGTATRLLAISEKIVITIKNISK